MICRVDKSSGKAKGGDEVFLLCEKVGKGKLCSEVSHGVHIFLLYKVFLIIWDTAKGLA